MNFTGFDSFENVHVNLNLNEINDWSYYLVNPFNLTVVQIVGFAALKMVSVEGLNFTIFQVLRMLNWPFLPSRVPTPISKGLESLEVVDYVYLTINTFIETIFLMHLFVFQQELKLSFELLDVIRSVASVYVIFIIDDFFYYWLHRTMHIPFLYPFIHKHHHRQSLPRRGYYDGANTSPFEQTFGLLCVWLTIHLTNALIGVDYLAISIFFFFYGALALLNHTPYDVCFPEFLGLGYSVRAHEIHHRLVRCNYAQNTMLWDKLFGTFEAYRDGRDSSKRK